MAKPPRNPRNSRNSPSSSGSRKPATGAAVDATQDGASDDASESAADNGQDTAAPAPPRDPVATAQALANVRPEPVRVTVPPPVLGTMDINALDDSSHGAGNGSGADIAAADALPATGDAVALTDSTFVPQQYQAPLIQGARDIEGEIGGSGLRGAEPYAGWIYEEYLPALRGLQGARFFKQMYDDDPTCGAIIFALRMLMKKVDWRVDPKDKTAESQLAAERVHDALFTDMADTWGTVIEESSSMLVYGYSPHEIIWKRCKGLQKDPMHSSQFDDGAWMPAALPQRSQDTIWRWIFDTQGKGNVLGFEQIRVGFPNAVVPMAKALLFRTDATRNNPEGRSVLRGGYKPYLRKNTIEEAEARLALRSSGIVNIRIPAKFMDYGAGEQEKQIFAYYKAMADKLAQDRQGSAVLPSDRDDNGNLLYDMGYTVADNRQLKDYTGIVDRYDSRIAITVLADFLLLGTKNVGSWALADSKTSLFVLAVEGFLAVIAEQINRVLLPKIFRLNGWDVKFLPAVKHGSVQKADLAVLGPFFQNLAAAGAPIFPSPDGRLEQWLLDQAGAPSIADVG